MYDMLFVMLKHFCVNLPSTAIDNKLSWKFHIAYISGKIARGIGIINKARRFLNKDSLLSLYYSFIYPYLIYCNHVWGTACKSYLKTVITLQKRVVRIIAGVKPRTHTALLFTKYKLLTCDDLNFYLVGRLMFRIYSGEIDSLRSLFETNEEIHHYETRQKSHYHIPSCKTNLGKRNFKYNGAVIWNDILKAGINPSDNEFLFAKNLKLAIIEHLI